MYAREGVVTLRESPSTITFLVLLLVLISGLPTNELRVAMNALERIRIYYNSVTMSKNALGICFESSTIFSNRGIRGQVLNISNILIRNPNRPTNCKN